MPAVTAVTGHRTESDLVTQYPVTLSRVYRVSCIVVYSSRFIQSSTDTDTHPHTHARIHTSTHPRIHASAHVRRTYARANGREWTPALLCSALLYSLSTLYCCCCRRPCLLSVCLCCLSVCLCCCCCLSVCRVPPLSSPCCCLLSAPSQPSAPSLLSPSSASFRSVNHHRRICRQNVN